MMNAKDYEAEWKWMNSSPEAKLHSDAAKAQALSNFKKRFPRADVTKFIAQVDFDANRKATGRVLFPDGDGSWKNPLIEDQKYWSQPLKDALGLLKRVAFLISYLYLCKTSLHQFQLLIFLKAKQGKPLLIFLTKR